MDKKVSIIVPVYNVASYLEQCINSLINQTYKNTELIFVNDGSTDNSLKILESYCQQDDRIQVISQRNQGLSAARNTGMEAASGDYMVFLDSDDWLEVSAIETAVLFSEQNNLDIVLWSYASEYEGKSICRPLFGGERIIFEDGRRIHRRIIGLTGKELSAPHKADACVTAWGKLYRRDVVADIRFVDTKRIGTEDALFNTCAFGNANRVGYLPDVFSHYRKTNETSLTRRYKADLAMCWENMYQLIEEYLDSISADDDFYTALSNRVCLSMIGIGLNELNNPAGFFRKTKNLRIVLRMPRWEAAYQRLDLQYFPIKWKVFFFLCKCKQTELLLLMLYGINALRGIIAN